MCTGCCDCSVIQENPLIMRCDGFKDNRYLVINNGRFTEHYRWCCKWSLEQIKQEELEYINLLFKKNK